MTAMTSAPTTSQQETLDAIAAHHVQLARAVAAAAVRVRDAADRLGDVSRVRQELVELLRTEVLPHAKAEEETLYGVGAGIEPLALLVQAMTGEHRILEKLVDELEAARATTETVGFAAAIRTLFEAHLAKENDLLLPALVERGVDLASLLEGMHEILGHEGAAEEQAGGCGCGGCGCGGSAESSSAGVEAAAGIDVAGAEDGDLDVRELPHGLRHEEIFKAVGRLEAGESFVLANDHDPVPLRYQLDAAAPGRISWEYLAQGPQVWRVRIGRIS